jgi:uracil-DNA glycosylase family 4
MCQPLLSKPQMDSISAPKQLAYNELVAVRRACRTCLPLGLTNPTDCQNGIYDNTGHIGPWTRWHGDLDASLMIVGQDWGGVEYYLEHKGLEEDKNPTNRNLIKLLASIGIEINLPTVAASTHGLFFTNAVLCLKQGRMLGPVKTACFNHCGAFLRKQIEIINPKVVATLGLHAYRAVLRSYGLGSHTRMRAAVAEPDLMVLPNGTTLVPVYHCGNNGLRSRTLAEQTNDWKRVEAALTAK